MELNKLEKNSDFRGTLVEAFKFPNDGQLFYIIVKPNETRGNHYHLKKTEHFLVIYGSAEIFVRDRATENVMKVSVNGSNPLVATVTPNNTHSITASEEGCILLVWSDTQFDEDNPDTYMEEI